MMGRILEFVLILFVLACFISVALDIIKIRNSKKK